LLKFRQMFVNHHDFLYEEAYLENLASNAALTWSRFQDALKNYSFTSGFKA